MTRYNTKGSNNAEYSNIGIQTITITKTTTKTTTKPTTKTTTKTTTPA